MLKKTNEKLKNETNKQKDILTIDSKMKDNNSDVFSSINIENNIEIEKTTIKNITNKIKTDSIPERAHISSNDKGKILKIILTYF